MALSQRADLNAIAGRVPERARAEQQPAVVRVEQAGVRPPARGIRGAVQATSSCAWPGSTVQLGPVDAKKAMFRIYRDTRFRKDKTPYKTHFSAAIRDRAKRGLEPGYYFEIDHRGILLAGGGIYSPEPCDPAAHPQLHRGKAGVALARCCAIRDSRRRTASMMDEDALARPPKGFSCRPAAHRRDQAAALFRPDRGEHQAQAAEGPRRRHRRVLRGPDAADDVAAQGRRRRTNAK